jgi:hypothetical protein
LRKFICDDQAAQIADLALVLPILIMLIFGILWFGRAFNIYTTVNRATREAAEAAALNFCATCVSTPVDIEANVVNPILVAAHLDPSQKRNFRIDPVTLNPSAPLQQQIKGFRAQMSYPYDFKLNGVTCCPPTLTPITLGVTITAKAQSQGEN